MPSTLELLAPAKNADIGIEAINHGADAVYIGGPASARAPAPATPSRDIERLAGHAPPFQRPRLVTLNTILRDDELEEARRMAWQMLRCRRDALIVQDMGLLELDLPPIQLHASDAVRHPHVRKRPGSSPTSASRRWCWRANCRWRSARSIQDCAGTTRRPRSNSSSTARCASAFSGPVLHQPRPHRAQRQPRRMLAGLPPALHLEDKQGRIVAFDKHLLSMKDNDQSANLRALIDAGIRSFKIEGG
jgi:collagenase-like PrtC family protease